MGQRALVRELAELGVSQVRTNSARLYHGLCLNAYGAVLAAGDGDGIGATETSRGDGNARGAGGSGRVRLS